MNLEEQCHAEEMLRKIERVEEDAEVSGLMASATNRLHLQSKKIGELHQQLSEAQAEALEQARIVSMGGEREIDLRQQVTLLRDALNDLASCMQGVIEGDYTPDSFTLQPANMALAATNDLSNYVLCEKEPVA